MKEKGKIVKGKMLAILLLVGLVCLGILYTTCLSSRATTEGKQWTNSFNVDKATFIDTGENPYFKLMPGYYLSLGGKEGQKDIRLVITVLNETQLINGVTTRVVEERKTENGELIEVSRNYFAIDKVTNSVFYFGEDVDIYENGAVVSHEGTWHSGENGARFGLMMPGIVLVGARYYQEIAEDVAMDRAEIISVTETIETPAGTFTGCLKTEETTPLEPGARECKIYAPGIGLVNDGNLKLVAYGYK